MAGALVPGPPAADKGRVDGRWHGTGRWLARRAVGLVRPAVDWALPPRCPGCGVIVGADHSFCLACWTGLDRLAGPACATCALPLPLAVGPEPRCAACLADPPPFAAVRAVARYGGIARDLALRLKHGRRPGLAQVMGRPMRRIAADLAGGALVAPVPLHRWRLWRRGYNQAALLARVVAGVPDAELAVDLLRRARPTRALGGLGRRARARTVQGAFACEARWAGRLAGRRVLLVDDVFTTGATARACARALLRAGAAEVAVLCWARVALDGGDPR